MDVNYNRSRRWKFSTDSFFNESSKALSYAEWRTINFREKELTRLTII